MTLHRRFFLSLVGAGLIAGLALSHPVSAADDAGAFISDLGGRVIGLVKTQAGNKPAVRENLRQIFRESVDTETIGRFVLGRYWRTATDEQRAEFGHLFENMVVGAYADRFMQYSGETLTVTGSRQEGDETLVRSTINRPHADAIEADWRLAKTDNTFRIIDVVVAGVSMRITHRSEFSSVIQSNGGSIEGLLASMRKRYSH